MFLAPWFFVAGLIAAAGPILIQLLNRRRYRTVHWAAMHFLREALVRSRRILQLRDLLLLALRVAVIVLFGAALARPFLGGAASGFDPDRPLHAVFLVDNSLSTGYEGLEGTVLDDIKTRVRHSIRRLPRGSRISVVPACGAADGFNGAAYYTADDALDALERIESIDRAIEPGEALDLAREACARVPEMPQKRIVLVTDQQADGWSAGQVESQAKALPAPLEIDVVRPDDPGGVENAWIADFRLRDGVADVQTPGVFLATIGYQGPYPRPGVQVTLAVDGVAVAAQTVDLMPGQFREVEFPPHRFNVPIEPGQATYVTAEVSIPQDRLPADDQRFLAVPVLAGLPVVFVDQFGPEEDRRLGRMGETYHLRRLLAPLSGSSESRKQPAEVRHLRLEQLDRAQLADARLVVVAGVANPEPALDLLREYVEQGGNLILAAGGDFDPALWTQSAWRDGMGILPAPLEPVAFGATPEEDPSAVKPFHLDFDSMVHGYFLIEESSPRELEDLYALPLFFKMVRATATAEAAGQMLAARQEDLRRRQEAIAEIDARLDALGAEPADPAARQIQHTQRQDLLRRRAQFSPGWLAWSAADDDFAEDRPAEEIAEDERFHVLARYSTGAPFIIERRIGRGKVLLVTTGLSTGWNTLPITNAVVMYDRILRSMLERTLPRRNLGTEQQVVIPVAAAQRGARFQLVLPDDRERPLSVDALGPDRFGVRLSGFDRRGVYRLRALRQSDQAGPDLESRLWEITLAVNGPAEESELIPAERSFGPRRGLAGLVAMVQPPVEGIRYVPPHARNLWRWFLVAVLVLLLVELLVLAWPVMKGEQPV